MKKLLGFILLPCALLVAAPALAEDTRSPDTTTPRDTGSSMERGGTADGGGAYSDTGGAIDQPGQMDAGPSEITTGQTGIPGTARQDASGIFPTGIDSKQVTGQEGAIVERYVSWTDDDGEHVAVFATTQKSGQRKDASYTSKTLYVTTFIRRDDGTWRKQQTIREVVPPCTQDMIARFVEGSVEVTNLDDDDDGELTFAYVTRCATDEKPLAMKVVTIEDNKKYTLTGDTQIDRGDGTEPMGGKYKTTGGKPPAPLLDHAKEVWERYKTTGY